MLKPKQIGIWPLALFLLGIQITLSDSHASPIAGQVELVEGDVRILDSQGQVRVPRLQDKIEQGDTIITGKDGELHARMEDQGFVAVRPSTKLKIDSYAANADKDDHMAISLLTGTFRSISGWIGKHFSQKYVIRTPSATIGIRGTDHEPAFIPEPGPGEKAVGLPGTYDKVNAGSTVIENASGKIFVEPGQAGYAPHDVKVAPKILERVPEFYRPTKNEHLIEKKKQQLDKEMEQKFLEKQKQRKPESSNQEEHHRESAEELKHRSRSHNKIRRKAP